MSNLKQRKSSKIKDILTRTDRTHFQRKPKSNRNLNLAPDFSKIYSEVKKNYSITKNLNLDIDKMVVICNERKDSLTKKVRIEKSKITSFFDKLKDRLIDVLDEKRDSFLAIFSDYENLLMKQEQEMHSQANKLEKMMSDLPKISKLSRQGNFLKAGNASRHSVVGDEYVEVSQVKIIDSKFRTIDSYDERWACEVDNLDFELQKLILNSSYKQVLNTISDYPTLFSGWENSSDLREY